MMVSMCLIPWDGRLAMREVAPVSEALERVSTISSLSSAADSDLRSSVLVVSERTVAITVVFWRLRREETSPRPIP